MKKKRECQPPHPTPQLCFTSRFFPLHIYINLRQPRTPSPSLFLLFTLAALPSLRWRDLT